MQTDNFYGTPPAVIRVVSKGRGICDVKHIILTGQLL